MSQPIFGFDIDGVLTADDDGKENLWVTRASKYFNLPIMKPSFYIEEALGVPTEQVHKFFEDNVAEILTTVPVRTQCVDVLQDIRREGYPIYLITARNYRLRALTEKWLQAYEIPFDELHMNPGLDHSFSKGDLCAKLGVEFFVDDKLENFRDVAERGVYTLLYHSSHNRTAPERLCRVYDWQEINSHVQTFLEGRKRTAL